MTAGGIKVARVELSKHVDCSVTGPGQAELSAKLLHRETHTFATGSF